MQSRNYGLDLLRGILMLIGVLIHASSIMSPISEWIYVSSLKLDKVSYGLIYTTHFFRMEAFFLIAGFFSILVINKKGREYYIENRIRRVLIPFITSIFTISPIVIYFSFLNQTTYNNILDLVDLKSIIIHFWFLITLMLLSLLTYTDKLELFIKKISRSSKFNIILSVLVVSYINVIVSAAIGKLDLPSTIVQIYKYIIFNTIYYGIYYLLGCSIYINRALINKLNISLPLIVFITLLTIILFYVRIEQLVDPQFILATSLTYFGFNVLSALFISIFLFNLFMNLNINSSKILNILVDSAIIIYLFHVPVLIYVSKYYDNYFSSSYLYYITICITTYVITFLIYYIIKNFKVLKLLYGLK